MTGFDSEAKKTFPQIIEELLENPPGSGILEEELYLGPAGKEEDDEDDYGDEDDEFEDDEDDEFEDEDELNEEDPVDEDEIYEEDFDFDEDEDLLDDEDEDIPYN